MPFRIVYINQQDYKGFEKEEFPKFIQDLEINETEIEKTLENLSKGIQNLHNFQSNANM